MSEAIKLDMPETWKRNKAWRLGKPMIVAAAFNPYSWTLGLEVLNGYGKGMALVVGPLWLGFAVAFSDDEA